MYGNEGIGKIARTAVDSYLDLAISGASGRDSDTMS
jgi:hypothetical protein